MVTVIENRNRTTRYATAVVFLALLLLLLLSGGRAGAYTLNGVEVDIRTPPGQRVDIGGYSLHIYCMGEGLPTIVFDSGIGGFSLEWSDIQAALARESRVCIYDRAGYGWSDRSPYPRTSNVIASELHRLLTRAAVPGPYLLVGHSFGGYNIRYFASEYPGKVDGLVLVDASHPRQFDYFPESGREKADSRVHRRYSVTRILRSVYPAGYPAEIRHLAYMLMMRRKSVEIQLAETEHFRESARQLIARPANLRDIPVTVLTRGRRVWPDNNYGDAMERIWSFLQRDLLSLSSRTEQRIAPGSGHSIHLDQPDLVIQSIRQNLRNARWHAARPNLVIGAHGEKEMPQLRQQHDVVLSGLLKPSFRKSTVSGP